MYENLIAGTLGRPGMTRAQVQRQLDTVYSLFPRLKDRADVYKRQERMRPYQHKVQYYETDRMGITHHSNYIRWMEEARVDFLEQLGWGYDRLEALGVGSPVLGVACSYKQPTTFHDTVEVTVCLKEYLSLIHILWWRPARCAACPTAAAWCATARPPCCATSR